MKRKGWPIWLLRDVPAFLGVMLSFLPLVILMISSERRLMRGKKLSYATFEAILIHVAHAEARLAFALWRQAYRRLGWHPRGVKFHVIPVDTWDDAVARYQTYHNAFCNMDGAIDSYVEHLRAQYGISQREAAHAHGSTDARQSRAAHHELVGVATSPFALILSSTRSVRPSKDERGHAHARGPPLQPIFPKSRISHLAGPACENAPACPIPLSIRPHIR